MNSEHRPEMPLSEVMQDWRDSNMRVRSKETVRLMCLSVQSFAALLGREPLLGDLTEQNLAAYIRHRRDVLRRSACTVEREAAKITTLWRWAATRGWTRFPLISFRKAAIPTPLAWSRQELARLFKAAAEYKTPMGKGKQSGNHAHVDGLPGNVMMTALLRVLFDTGERITALLAITWADVDLDGRWVNFRGSTRKGGDRAQDNLQRLSRRTCKALVEMRTAVGTPEPTSLCFPAKHKTTWGFHLKRILKDAGLPADRKHMFHCLRRTHATHLYAVGGDATFSLGHSSEQITRDYYLDPRYVRKDYAADLLSGGVTEPIRRMFRRVKAAFGLW